MEIFLQSETWIALLTLIFMEIVLGIDNIIFISLVAGRLPENQQRKARLVGLSLALIMRVLMLFGITWIIGFTKPLFTLFEHEFSGRDLILIGGGLFLLTKSTMEIRHKVTSESEESEKPSKRAVNGITSAIFQIILLDIVFSFDSILTAIGMTSEITLMVIAVIVSIIVMMIAAAPISKFISNHPTLQILALSFLILIAVMLLVDGFGHEIPKGYIYFALFFSLAVELINLWTKKRKSKN